MQKTQTKILSFINTIIILILSVGFLGIGMLKLVAYPQIYDPLKSWGLPEAIIYLIGFIELALALVIYYQPTRVKGLIGASFLMVSALAAHIYFKETNLMLGPIFVVSLLFLSFIIEKIKK